MRSCRHDKGKKRCTSSTTQPNEGGKVQLRTPLIRFVEREEKVRETLRIFGRKPGSWSQQRWVNAHKPSVQDGCSGREGRSPLNTASTTVQFVFRLLNGTSPVSTCVGAVTFSRYNAYFRPYTTYLDCDHGKRVNVRFLAGILFTEDFWSRPSRSVRFLTCRRPYGIQVFRHDRDPEIRNTCMGDVVNNIHKYVHLADVSTTVS